MIELPVTIRAPKKEDVTKNDSIEEMLLEIDSANIVEGFEVFYAPDTEDGKKTLFNFYSEINIDNSRLWDLVMLLSQEMPNEASLIVEFAEEEKILGDYINKSQLLNHLSDFKKELTNDAFIGWGVIYNDESSLIEIFISESKYVKFWGMNEESFREKMSGINLSEIKGIEFIDEHPNVRESLRMFDENALETHELVSILKDEYCND